MKITTKPSPSFWQSGTVGPYRYMAKAFDKPSEFGIDGGNISKLEISDQRGVRLADYDREWLERPHWFQFRRRAAIRAILRHYAV